MDSKIGSFAIFIIPMVMDVFVLQFNECWLPSGTLDYTVCKETLISIDIFGKGLKFFYLNLLNNEPKITEGEVIATLKGP